MVFFPSCFATEDADNPKGAKRSLLQSIFCCWRRQRTRGPKSNNGGILTYGEAALAAGRQSSGGQLRAGPVRHLLPPVRHQDMHKKCMVIDLDETLVHSSFKVSWHNSILREMQEMHETRKLSCCKTLCKTS